MCVVIRIYFVYYSPWLVRIWCKQGDFFLTDWKIAGFVSLSVSFNQHSGATYPKSKLYVVVKLSSDIVTEHCCQVYVLAMMICHSDSQLCADIHLSDCAIRKLEYHVVWLHSDRSTWEMIWNYSLHLIFTFYLQRHIGVRIVPCRCISIKRSSMRSVLTHLLGIKTVPKIVGFW